MGEVGGLPCRGAAAIISCRTQCVVLAAQQPRPETVRAMNAKPSRKKWILYAAFSALVLTATAYFGQSIKRSGSTSVGGVSPVAADDWVQRAQKGGGQPDVQVDPTPTGLSQDSRETLALMVNLSGQLCAKVTAVSPLGGDVYNVSCVRYRDGTGSAVYEVNAKSGLVR